MVDVKNGKSARVDVCVVMCEVVWKGVVYILVGSAPEGQRIYTVSIL